MKCILLIEYLSSNESYYWGLYNCLVSTIHSTRKSNTKLGIAKIAKVLAWIYFGAPFFMKRKKMQREGNTGKDKKYAWITSWQIEDPDRITGDGPWGPHIATHHGDLSLTMQPQLMWRVLGAWTLTRIGECPMGNLFWKYLFRNLSVRCIQAPDTHYLYLFVRPHKCQYEELNFPNRIDRSGSLLSSNCRNEMVISES